MGSLIFHLYHKTTHYKIQQDFCKNGSISVAFSSPPTHLLRSLSCCTPPMSGRWVFCPFRGSYCRMKNVLNVIFSCLLGIYSAFSLSNLALPLSPLGLASFLSSAMLSAWWARLITIYHCPDLRESNGELVESCFLYLTGPVWWFLCSMCFEWELQCDMVRQAAFLKSRQSWKTGSTGWVTGALYYGWVLRCERGPFDHLAYFLVYRVTGSNCLVPPTNWITGNHFWAMPKAGAYFFLKRFSFLQKIRLIISDASRNYFHFPSPLQLSSLFLCRLIAYFQHPHSLLISILKGRWTNVDAWICSHKPFLFVSMKPQPSLSDTFFCDPHHTITNAAPQACDSGCRY